MSDEIKCENCMEWEYFEGYGYGCFCMKTMTPLDANKCENYAYKWSNRACKALDNEGVLDKIRKEIEVLPKTYPFVNHIDTYVKEDDVKKIIDKYIGGDRE